MRPDPSRRSGATVDLIVLARLLRSRWWRPALVVCVVAVAVPIASFLTLSAFSLTRADVQDRDFGRFEARLDFSTWVPPGPSPMLRELTSLQHEGTRGSGWTLELVSDEVRTTADPDVPLFYQETDWRTDPYPGLTLQRGRWPSSPGEVLLSDTMGQSNGELSVLSGRGVFTVVGTVSSRFSDGPGLYAAVGTWRELPRAARLARELLGAEARLLMDTASAPLARSRADETVPGTTTLLRRSDAAAETSWVLESPLSFIAPAGLLPFLSGSLAVVIVGARRRNFVYRAIGVGMAPRRAALASVGPVVTMAVPGLLAGVAIGLVGGYAGRWIGAASAHQESSLPNVWTPIAVASISLLLGLVITAGWVVKISPSQSTTPTGTSSSAHALVTRLRRGSALLLGLASLFVLFRVSGGQSAMVFALVLLLVLLLLLPDTIGSAARLLSERRPEQRLARRLLASPGREQVVGTAFVAVLLTLPLVTSVLSSATGLLERNNALAEVGEGQLGLSGRGGLGDAPTAKVAAIVDDGLDNHPSTQVLFALNAWYALAEGNAVAEGNAAVILVPTPEDVEALGGRPLNSTQRRTLADGGVLTWQRGARLLVDQSPVTVRISEYLPTPEWAASSGAVMLEQPARDLGIEGRPGMIVYLDVSASQAEETGALVAAAGLDPSQVHTHHAPKPLVPPAPLVASAVLLFAALVVSLTLATRAHAKGLRALFNRTIMIGSSPRFTRRTYLTIVGYTFAVAGAVAVVVTAGCVLAIRTGAPTVELNLSWTPVLAGFSGAVLALWTGARLGLRRLTGH